MSRTQLMTTGIVLILIGVQLNLVESFVLTAKATDFWNSRFSGNNVETVPADYVATSDGYFRRNAATPVQDLRNPNNRFAYSTPSFQRVRGANVTAAPSSFTTSDVVVPDGQKMLTPPSWLTWPPIFLGAVFLLFGAASKE